MSLKRTKALAPVVVSSLLVASLIAAPALQALQPVDRTQPNELFELQTEEAVSFSGWIGSVLDWLGSFVGAAASTAELCVDCSDPGTTEPSGESGSAPPAEGGTDPASGDGEVGGQLDPFG